MSNLTVKRQIYENLAFCKQLDDQWVVVLATDCFAELNDIMGLTKMCSYTIIIEMSVLADSFLFNMTFNLILKCQK